MILGKIFTIRARDLFLNEKMNEYSFSEPLKITELLLDNNKEHGRDGDGDGELGRGYDSGP